MTKKIIGSKYFDNIPFPCSPAVQAGEWVFTSGLMATDWTSGILKEYQANQDFPNNNYAMSLQTEGIYQILSSLLQEAGTSVDNMVRIDQFTPYHDQFRHYLPIRDQYLTEGRPASTALAVKNLMINDAQIELDGIAIIPSKDTKKEAINSPSAPTPRAGYSLAIRYGDWIWCSGSSPTDFKSRAPYPGGKGHTQPEEIQVDPNFWYGSEIEKQAAYDLYKLRLYLEEANSSLDNIVKLDVYLTDTSDYPGLLNVLQENFADNMPAVTIVPIDQMGIGGSRVEINCIALTNGSKIKRGNISSKKIDTPDFAPHAVKAGPYLFLSGRQANDLNKISPFMKPHSSSPFVNLKGKEEMKKILADIDTICQEAGGSINDLVKMQIFATELNDMPGAIESMKEVFSDAAPAVNIIGVTGPHVIPSLSLATNLIAYIP